MRETIALYEINRQTIANQIFEKHVEIAQRENKLFLTINEKTTFFRFVNYWVVMNFSFKLNMLIEKIVLLFRERNIKEISDINWSKKFLRRHSEYDFKFSRNLNQKKHWNSKSIVMINWFDLYDRICLKYDIAIDDQYNMNEKNYMMKMTKIEKSIFLNFEFFRF